jgi:hypothetical protein
MDDQNGAQRVSAESQQWTNQTPKGTICDREQTGLLLDVRAPDDSADGYVFLPWSSIEQVEIREVSQRRVKSLPS